jgi:hypothetical protein
MKLNWTNDYAMSGRHVKACDAHNVYCAAIPEGMTLDEAINDYADTHSYGDEIASIQFWLHNGESVASRVPTLLIVQPGSRCII